MPIGNVSIFTLYCKMGRSKIQTKLKAGSIPMTTFSQLLFNPFGKCCGTACNGQFLSKEPRGNSSFSLLGRVWAKRHDVDVSLKMKLMYKVAMQKWAKKKGLALLLSPFGNWWRRRDLNPRPESLHPRHYMFSLSFI